MWGGGSSECELPQNVMVREKERKAVDPALHSSDFSTSTSIGSVVVLLLMMFLVLFAVHCTWVTSNAYSSPSVVLASTNHDG